MILQRNNELMMYMLYVCLKEPNFRQNTFKIDRRIGEKFDLYTIVNGH